MQNCDRIASKKASRWFKERDCFISAIQDPRNRQMRVTSVGPSGVFIKTIPIKDLAGRGRKRATWIDYVRTIQLMDFERYVAAGVQVCRNILVDMALRVINEPG